MQDYRYKEVFFGVYCSSCKYEKCKETDEPCDECLNEPVNLDSHKPVNWTEND